MATVAAAGLHLYVKHKISGRPFFILGPKKDLLLDWILPGSTKIRPASLSTHAVMELDVGSSLVDLNMI
jgi:hypothetical protein